MLLPLAMLAAALSAAQAAPVPATPYLCQADLGEVDGGRIAWVNLLLDDDRRPVRRELYLRNGRFDGVWDLDAGRPAARPPMRESRYTVELPRAAAFPVDVRIVGDGRTLWRGTFEHSGGDVVHYPAMERFSSILLAWGPGRPIANVYGIERLRIVVRDARGAKILDERVPLPDWRWIGAGTRIALREVERQRDSGGCGPSAIP